ncbi:MAG: hypothetical protein GF334_01905 [Candidatus Altiarchaeales archaeon]|nr:hypothetical protein [Candidatus Altiarchaeales archaeon]
MSIFSRIGDFISIMRGDHRYDDLVVWESEQAFWEKAKYRIPNLVPQHRVGRRRIDFAQLDTRLAIEVMGKRYHGGNTEESIEESWVSLVADWERGRELLKKGWIPVYFPAADCFSRPEYVVNEVLQIMKGLNRG